MILHSFKALLTAGSLAMLSTVAHVRAAAQAELWLTHPGGSARFQRQDAPVVFEPVAAGEATIALEDGRSYQTMDGFGYTLTGGSALHIIRMTPAARSALLRELFATDSTNIGVSYLRVSIGASDLSTHVFSYDDLPAGETDPGLARFSLAEDRQEVIPVLQEILAVNPALKILGSPWSAPSWMKSNRDSRGGSLRREFYEAYARYFVKYIEGMKAEGIPIDAVTVQNEPLHPGNEPSMYMPAVEQAEFIKRHLGPAFKAAGLATKIICYDHNADRPDYPISVLNDPETKPFVDGSAFHLYAGEIQALTRVHDAHPDKNLYFTEQWIGAPGNLRGDLAWHVNHLIVGATRHWCRTVLEWNLASDPAYRPHTDRGGCNRCLGAITIDGDKVTRNPAYYIIAHASKFVRPGSVRIGSSMPPSLANVAFRTPDGRTVLIVLNGQDTPVTFTIGSRGAVASAALPASAVGTYVW